MDPAIPVPVTENADVSMAPLALTRAMVKLPVDVVAEVASADQHVNVKASRAAVSASPPCELDTSPVHARPLAPAAAAVCGNAIDCTMLPSVAGAREISSSQMGRLPA